MNLHDERPVALHEAAHAVVAWVLGISCERLQIQGVRVGNERMIGTEVDWVGDYFPPDEVVRTMSSEIHAKIALAGAICNVKSHGAGYLAQEDGTDVNSVLTHITVPDSSLPRIASALLEESSQQHQRRGPVSAPNPGLDVELDGEIRVVQGCLGEVSADMEVIYGNMGRVPSEDELVNLLREVRDILDKPENWSAVVQLAGRLMRELPREVVQKELCGKCVTSELERALGRRGQ